MLDLHCHIAYGSDDGAESPEVALSMIELAVRCDTKFIAVTPHSNNLGSYRNYFDEGIADKLRNLRRLTKERGIDVKLFSGQEIFMTDNVVPLLECGKLCSDSQSKNRKRIP